jgi:hypothetical protein
MDQTWRMTDRNLQAMKAQSHMPNEWRPGLKFYKAVREQDGEPVFGLAIYAADEAVLPLTVH